MTTRDIQVHLKELFGTVVSAEPLSLVTDEVMEGVRGWQSRPLDPMWPLVYLDALTVTVRHQGTERNKAQHLTLGVDLSRHNEMLEMWMEDSDEAKFWLKLMTELKNRGVEESCWRMGWG